MLEEEQSPFKIAQTSKGIFDKLLERNADWQKYRKFLERAVSIRILQRCRSYFKTMKLTYLLKLLVFYDKMEDIENLLYECNRTDLVATRIEHSTSSITFDPSGEQVTSSLSQFTSGLTQVVSLVQQAQSDATELKK